MADVRRKRDCVRAVPRCDDGCGRLECEPPDVTAEDAAREHAQAEGHVTFVRETWETSFWPKGHT